MIAQCPTTPYAALIAPTLHEGVWQCGAEAHQALDYGMLILTGLDSRSQTLTLTYPRRPRTARLAAVSSAFFAAIMMSLLRRPSCPSCPRSYTLKRVREDLPT